ncbi:hypothetical protein OH77DRAFT_1431987 [Trametes cingulata]|nr:hypothetical protein OH77DRAFT_1431987 [Trametes cingulata]
MSLALPFPLDRRLVEQAISDGERYVLFFRGYLNGMALIARLPPELLSEVFLHIVRWAFEDIAASYYLSSGGSRFYTWITVSHVCRAWRAVALGTPRLWSHIVLTRSPVFVEVFKRSKKAPLVVLAPVPSLARQTAELLNHVLLEPARLQDLRLYAPAHIVRSTCKKLTGPLPLLENVILADHSYPVSGYTEDSDALPPPTSFCAPLSKLRSLEICRLAMSWQNPVLSSTITELVVIGRFDMQRFLGSFDDLLGALETLSHLRVLELADSIPMLPEDTTKLPTPQRVIALPELRRLALTGPTLDCAFLVNHLSFPAHTRIFLRGYYLDADQEFLRTVQNHSARSGKLLAVRLSRAFSRTFVMKGWLTPESQSFDPFVEVQLDAPNSYNAASKLARHALFASVRVLTIDVNYYQWTWRTVLAGFPGVRTLSVHGHPDKLLSALCATRKPRNKHDHLPSQLPLPLLEVMKLSDVSISRPLPDGLTFLHDLEDWLLLRCNHEMPITDLHLNDCYGVTKEDVARLAQIVTNVTWDGAELYDGIEEEDETEPASDNSDLPLPYYDYYFDFEDE